MSDEGLTSQTPDAAASGSRSADRTASLPMHGVCPYLLSADGAWRSTSAARDHRCTAVNPPSPLAAEKQRRLCLTADHLSCATFVAANEAMAVARRPVDLRRPIARTTPLVLDQGRLMFPLPSLTSAPMAGQGALIGLLGVAFGAVLIARLATGGGGGEAGVLVPVGSATPGPAATDGAVAITQPPATAEPATAAPSVEPTEAPAATVEPSPTLVPTGPSPTPVDATPASYKVKRGDTLSGIAAQFGTTVKVLVELNDIKDPARLRVGQVIKLP
jgi:LysM repeat protein